MPPTVGVDPQSRNHILGAVVEMNKQGTTVLYTSYCMEEVGRVFGAARGRRNGSYLVAYDNCHEKPHPATLCSVAGFCILQKFLAHPV
jgi:hypothetical protein